jgi:hypothetical protein
MARGVIDQGRAAQIALDRCQVPLAELQQQWELQKQSQLSLRARTSCVSVSHSAYSTYPVDAPARLKRELDAVLNLQADLDNVSSAIQSAKSQLQGSNTVHAIASLERTNRKLTEKVESLYASLNVHDSFRELNDVDLDFVRTLLLARDLKINIRKRAIGSFFEWERLDQAVGGKNQVLGNNY